MPAQHKPNTKGRSVTLHSVNETFELKLELNPCPKCNAAPYFKCFSDFPCIVVCCPNDHFRSIACGSYEYAAAAWNDGQLLVNLFPQEPDTEGQSMNENTPENSPCSICGADECCCHDLPKLPCNRCGCLPQFHSFGPYDDKSYYFYCKDHYRTIFCSSPQEAAAAWDDRKLVLLIHGDPAIQRLQNMINLEKGLPHISVAEPENCPVCGADECCGHDLPVEESDIFIEEQEPCPICGCTAADQEYIARFQKDHPLPIWRKVLYAFFRPYDLSFYLCLVFNNYVFIQLLTQYAGQQSTSFSILGSSIAVSSFLYSLFTIVRFLITSLYYDICSLVAKQQSTITQRENHG